MSPDELISRWKGVTLTERASSQSHFNDLCLMLGEKAPVEADPSGTWYAFEKGAKKAGVSIGSMAVCSPRATHSRWRRPIFNSSWRWRG